MIGTLWVIVKSQETTEIAGGQLWTQRQLLVQQIRIHWGPLISILVALLNSVEDFSAIAMTSRLMILRLRVMFRNMLATIQRSTGRNFLATA